MFNIIASKETCKRICSGCYAIGEQNRYPSVIKARTERWEASKRLNFAIRINHELRRLKHQPKYFRIHASGEFYSQEYINHWVQITKANPHIIFYAYTKRMKDFDFSDLKSQSNFILINSLHFGELNYGTLEEAPTNAFICPAQSGTQDVCGKQCTYCMTKQAQTNGVWFIKH